MNGATLLRIKELFLAASDLPEGARAEFLDAQPDLTADARAHIDEQLALLERTDDSALASPAAASSAAEAPAHIGPYRVLRRIGEGGMGVVYLAEQTAPIARQVAVKRVRAGMDTSAMLRRFEAERLALERMDHPSIARVLDAGVDGDGRPYFVMEYVDGVSLIEYCDREQLDPDARLCLFAEVCRGVQHAHQKGVIHRDLKPSNVLVATIDARPVPKIIDFGVAKALERELTEQTLQTQLGMLIGTPEYMSPEQAEPGAADVDTRSDVYSLGVLLYELLSGELPFPPGYLRERGLAGIQHVLQHEDPPRPSTRVSTQMTTSREHTAEQARRRRLEPGALAQRLRGDLDWITMRALEKERERRYGSAGELAADIERHLHDEPVLAGPPTVRYRLSKYLRRHRGQAASATAIAVALVLGAGVAVWFAFDARTERDRAIALAAQRDAARREAESAVDSVRDTLSRSASRLEDAFASGAETRAAEAETHSMLGEAFLGIGDLDPAVHHLARAFDILRDVPGSWPDQAYRVLRSYNHVCLVGTSLSTRWMLEGVMQRTEMAVLAGGDARMSAALERFRAQSWADPDDGPFTRLMELAEATFAPDDPRWRVLPGFVQGMLGDSLERKAWVERLMRIHADHGIAPYDLQALKVQLCCAQHFDYLAIGCHREALALVEDALAAIEGRFREDHYIVGLFELERGYALAHLGELDEAWPPLVEALAILEREVGPDATLAVWALLAQVQLFDLQGRGAEPEARELKALFAERVARCSEAAPAEWVEAALSPDHPEMVELVREIEVARRDPAIAGPRIQRLLSLAQDGFARRDARAAVVASYLTMVGQDLTHSGARREDMVELFGSLLELTAADQDWDIGMARWWLANHCYVRSDFERVVEVATPGIERPVGRLDPGVHAMLRILSGLARFELGETEAGLAEALEGYRVCVSVHGDQNQNVKTALDRIAGALLRAGRRAEALDLYRARVRRQLTWHSGVQDLWLTADIALRSLGADDLVAELLETLRERFPHDWQTSALEARLAANRFDVAATREHAAAAIARGGHDAGNLNSMAGVYARLGLLNEADATAQLAIAAADSRARRNNRAYWSLQLGDLDRAQELFEQLADTDPEYAYAHQNLAECWLQRGDVDRALDAARRAWQLDREVGQGVLGRALLASGQLEEATPLLVAHIEDLERPDGEGDVRDYAEALARSGRFDEARECLARLTDTWPLEPFAWSERALALCRSAPDGEALDEDLAAALACAERAVELSGRRGPVMLAALAEVTFRRGNAQRAVELCDEVLEAMAGRDAAWLPLAEVERCRAHYAAAR